VNLLDWRGDLVFRGLTGLLRRRLAGIGEGLEGDAGRATATADPYGMTTKRTSNSNGNGSGNGNGKNAMAKANCKSSGWL
jgi:hypothetical protein